MKLKNIFILTLLVSLSAMGVQKSLAAAGSQMLTENVIATSGEDSRQSVAIEVFKSDKAILQNLSLHQQTDSLVLNGVLKKNYPGIISSAIIHAKFYDANGKLVGHKHSSVFPTFIRNNSTDGHFSVTTDFNPAITTCKITIEAS